jgi:hypothetical protein
MEGEGMAKKAAAAVEGLSKSEAIRTFKNENPDAGPKAISAALAADGMKVTPAFVSTVLSNDKRKSGTIGRGRGRRAGGGDSSVDNLIQAKKLAEQMGGIEQARAALNALERILA